LDYILADRNKPYDPRLLKLAMVSGDPLGPAFGVKVFHRCQVVSLIKTQLKSFVLGPSTLSSTRREATARKVRVLKKRKSVEGGDYRDSGELRPQPGDREGLEQGTSALDLSLHSEEGLLLASHTLGSEKGQSVKRSQPMNKSIKIYIFLGLSLIVIVTAVTSYYKLTSAELTVKIENSAVHGLVIDGGTVAAVVLGSLLMVAIVSLLAIK
jgi:hypothetical protein